MIYFILIVFVLLVAFIFAYRSAKKLDLNHSKNAPDSGEGILLSIQLPKENEKTPIAAEQMFASLHGLLKFTPEVSEHLSLEISSNGNGINFYVFTPKRFKSFVEGQIYAQYPNAEIKEAVDYAKAPPVGTVAAATEISLAKDFLFPIKTFRDFEVDPLAAVTGAVGSVGAGEQIWLQILMRPIDDFWQEHGHQYVEMVRSGEEPVTMDAKSIAIDVLKHTFSHAGNIATMAMRGPEEHVAARPGSTPPPPKLSAGVELDLKMIENKLSKMGFEVKIRVLAFAKDLNTAEHRISAIAASFQQFSTASLNSFETRAVGDSASELQKFQAREFVEDATGDFVLNIEEMASIYHMPNIAVETPTIAWTRSKKGEPPLNLPTEGPGVTVIGSTFFRDHSQKFGIKKQDRRKHLYVIGKTGSGKSTLMKNMIIQDMRNGEGVAVLDPHGQLIDELLDFVPTDRLDDVVYFNPADGENPVSLNMLEIVDPRQRTLMADALVDVFKKYFAESWGPRLEYILKNCILTLLEVPNTSLLSVTRLLTDNDYRKFIVDKINDPLMKDFWNKEFAGMQTNPRLITEAISPIQNKVGQFLNSELIRNIVGQPKSTIKIDEIINQGKIFFVDLAVGRIGDNNTALLGAMIVSQLQFAAMRRVDMPEENRKDFFLYADEFQKFATDSFATVLSEARKYRLNLSMTHQYIEQMPEAVKEAIFGNVGSLIVFNVGPGDAFFLEKEFAPTFLQGDIMNLGRYEIYMKLQIDDQVSPPFSAVSQAPLEGKTSVKEQAITSSRMKFARPRERVEKIIRKWAETKFRSGQAPIPPAWATQETKMVDVPVEGQSAPPLFTRTSIETPAPFNPNLGVPPAVLPTMPNSTSNGSGTPNSVDNANNNPTLVPTQPPLEVMTERSEPTLVPQAVEVKSTSPTALSGEIILPKKDGPRG